MRSTLPYIEGVRGAAALYVVLGHLCTLVDPRIAQNQRTDTPQWIQTVMVPFGYGHLAVASFIVVSGFCLQMSNFDRGDGSLRGVGKFFLRRAKRLLPAYYGCLALSVGVALTVTSSQLGMPFRQYLPVTRENTLAHVLLVHNWRPEWMYKINGVLWSIATEVHLYVLFPLLVLLLMGLGRWGLLAAAGGVAAWQIGWHPEWMKLYVWYLPLFAFGMAGAHFAFRPNLRRGVRPHAAGWLGAALALGALLAIRETRELWPRDLLMGAAVACWLYSGTVAPRSFPARVFGWGPLALIGIFSYSLYLMHHPIMQTLYVFRPAWAVGPARELLYLSAVGIPVVLLGCIVFFWVFERPFLTRRAKATRRKELELPGGELLQTPFPLVEPVGARRNVSLR